MEPESGGCFWEQRVQIKARPKKKKYFPLAKQEGWTSLGVKQLLHVGVSVGGCV